MKAMENVITKMISLHKMISLPCYLLWCYLLFISDAATTTNNMTNDSTVYTPHGDGLVAVHPVKDMPFLLRSTYSNDKCGLLLFNTF